MTPYPSSLLPTNYPLSTTMDSTQNPTDWNPSGHRFSEQTRQQLGDETRTEQFQLSLFADGNFGMTHSVSTYDPFDGETDSTDQRVRGRWTTQDGTVQLTGETERHCVSYKHAMDSDDTSHVTHQDFTATYSYEYLRQMTVTPI